MLTLVAEALVDRLRLCAADITSSVVRYTCRGQPKEIRLLVITQPALVGWLLHTRQQRSKQIRFLIDQLLAGVVGELEFVGHRQRPGRTGLDAQSAQDAAQVVDLVDAAVTLAWRIPRLLGVLRSLDVDRVGRAGPGAQLAPDTFLQSIWPAIQLVPPVKARCGDSGTVRIVDRERLAKHRLEGHAEASDGIKEPHQASLPSLVCCSLGDLSD